MLLLASECSPFYLINDWVDVNSFFTTGKGMMNGKVPYLDLFEQKGPTLYLIYGIGYLFSHTTFLGVFIIQCIFISTFLYYIGKITDLFCTDKIKYIVSPIFLVVILTSLSYTNGGSAEEFCFPMFAISLYYYLLFLKTKQITNKTLFVNGLIAGLVFTIKFTLLGFWFGWMATIFLYLIIEKKYKNAFVSCLYFLAGMIIPFMLWCIYFFVVGGLGTFINTYFILNLTVYSTPSSSIIEQLRLCFTNFYNDLLANGVLIFTLFMFILVFINTEFKKNIDRLMLFMTFFFSILFVYIGGTHFSYYCLILLPWLILSLIFIFKLFPKKLLKNSILVLILTVIVSVLSIIMCYFGANYREKMFNKKSDDYHFIFADIIKKDKKENQTLLNYGALDFGLYTSANIVPNVRYFHMLNLPYDKYPYNVDAHNEYVTDKKVNYILCAVFSSNSFPTGLLSNYEIISSKKQLHANLDFTFYLLKLKEEI